MKAEELRINNWVKDENGPYQIKGEHLDEDNFPTIQTWEIPLTEEWLLKFGFENWDKNKWVDSNSVLTISKNDDNFLCLINQRDVDILYVHQLQNLYFALTGKELTLKDNL